MSTITMQLYSNLDKAYTFFNQQLFNGELPDCAIILTHKKGVKGYFVPNRYVNKNINEEAAEIGLNPEYAANDSDFLAELVANMVHFYQHRKGKPSRTGYHNYEYQEMMFNIAGLKTSDTGAPGGKVTGQKMSQYIEPHGKFAEKVELLKIKAMSEWTSKPEEVKPKAASAERWKYTCNNCKRNIWAKPNTPCICGFCFKAYEDIFFMESEASEEGMELTAERLVKEETVLPIDKRTEKIAEEEEPEALKAFLQKMFPEENPSVTTKAVETAREAVASISDANATITPANVSQNGVKTSRKTNRQTTNQTQTPREDNAPKQGNTSKPKLTRTQPAKKQSHK